MEFSSSRWIFYITSFVYQSVTAKNVARVRYCRISTGLKGRSDLGLIWASRFSALLHWLSPLKGSATGCHLKWWTKVWCLFFGPTFFLDVAVPTSEKQAWTMQLMNRTPKLFLIPWKGWDPVCHGRGLSQTSLQHELGLSKNANYSAPFYTNLTGGTQFIGKSNYQP